MTLRFDPHQPIGLLVCIPVALPSPSLSPRGTAETPADAPSLLSIRRALPLRRPPFSHPLLSVLCTEKHEIQVLYHDSGRVAIVACALVAFLALSWGMWLFIIVTPAFYWFGVPAGFLVLYTAFHCENPAQETL